MRTLAIFLAPLLAISFATLVAAQDQMTDTEAGTEFVCPVGGETFRQNVEMHYFPLESLPNGSNPGGNMSDVMVPACPGNGLVMVPKYDGDDDNPEAFAAYSEEELARLPTLIASPEYKALAGDANYLKLYWLSGQLGRPVIQRFHLLQHVSWVGKTPEQHRRYLELFVRDADVLIDSPDFDSGRRLTAKFYVANALRELGRFDEATARLPELQVIWDGEVAKLVASMAIDPNFETDVYDEQGVDVGNGFGFGSNIEVLRAAIGERDDDTFPVSMMGDKWANAVCGNVEDAYPPATELTKRNCAKRQAERKDYYANSQKDYEASEALLENPAKLAPMCKETPEGARDKILAEACRRAEYKVYRANMEAGAARLLKNPGALDPQCKGLIFGRDSRPKTALGLACQQRRVVLNEAESKALAAKFRKQPAEFDRQCTMGYPQSFSDDPLEAACGVVTDEREDARDAIIEARLAKMSETEISAECEKAQAERNEAPAGVPMVIPYTPLSSRCSDIKSAREDAQWKALEADPAKLAATCALSDSEQEEWTRMRCYIRQDELEQDAAMALAVDRDRLVATCAATPVPQRDRILYKACSGYRSCLVVRTDELPFSEANIALVVGPYDPSDLQAVCYESSEKADAAYARYRADPKSLRASCEPETEYGQEPYDPELCARYARGEDIFAETRGGPENGTTGDVIVPPPPVVRRPGR